MSYSGSAWTMSQPPMTTKLALLLEAAHVLGDQQRRLQLLAQPLVAEGGDRGVAVRVLVPEVAGLVAGAADVERVHEGAQLARRVDHQRHVVADARAHAEHVLGLAPAVAVVPAVDLEALVAERLAVLGEVGERLGAVEAARLGPGRGRCWRRPAGACGSRRAAARPARRTSCRRGPRARCRAGRGPCGRRRAARASGRRRSARGSRDRGRAGAGRASGSAPWRTGVPTQWVTYSPARPSSVRMRTA